ncbi:hypothetical protein Tco_0368216 [Tanacetum coccineum]
MEFYVGESSNQRSRGRMEQQWHQSQRNDQRNDKGSWIKRKLNNIRLKKLHDINKIGILESQQENRNKEEFKARRLMNDVARTQERRCYLYKGMGTFKDQAKGFADHFSTTVAGMDVVAEPNKHVSNNKAFKKIKKEDDDSFEVKPLKFKNHLIISLGGKC